MCTHGGTRYGNAGCRRTYLSQRDLQAHINHRHVATHGPMEVVHEVERLATRAKTNDPRATLVPTNVRQRVTAVPLSGGLRTNLITVPIHDSAPVPVHDAPPPTYYNQYPQQSYSQQLPPMHLPPPPQATPYYVTPQPAYSPAQTYPQYSNPAPPPATQYGASGGAQPRTQPPPYDYNTPPQWTSNQQYYR